MSNPSILDSTAERARALEASKIRQSAEMGVGREGLIPLWFGEGAWETNATIVEAAVASLQAGNHKYQPNNGSLDLREEICRYSNALYGCALTPAQITVTPSGMQGLMLAAELLELKEQNMDLGLLGFSQDELDQLFGESVADGQTDPDAIPEPSEDATTQPGDLWILGDHRLLCGDASRAEDVDRLLAPGGLHLFTVPVRLAANLELGLNIAEGVPLKRGADDAPPPNAALDTLKAEFVGPAAKHADGDRKRRVRRQEDGEAHGERQRQANPAHGASPPTRSNWAQTVSRRSLARMLARATPTPWVSSSATIQP